MRIPDRTLRITKLAIIESLREIDGRTGEMLAQDVANGLAAHGVQLAVQVLRCSGANGFRQIMAHLAEEATREEHHPLIHIECHGDDVAGLELSDGSMVSWLELADLMTPINVATELGLIVSVAACFGISAIMGVNMTKPAPCFALIGPSEGIWSSEMFDALKDFYLNLMVRTTTEEAVRQISEVRLENGGYLVLTVRQLFREVMLLYLREETSMPRRKAQALRQHRKALAEGMNLGLTYWKRHYLTTMPKFLRDYHARFFMLERFPEHAQHFASSMREVEEELKRRGFA